MEDLLVGGNQADAGGGWGELEGFQLTAHA